NGVIDGSDFGVWNANKFQSALAIAAVPEPSASAFAWLILFLSSGRVGFARGKTSSRNACAWIVLLGIVANTSSAQSVESDLAEPESAELGRRNDETAVLRLDGTAFDLWEDHRAAATVLVFLRSDCPISNRYAPELLRLHNRFDRLGVRFVMVYVDPLESADTIRNHLQEFQFPGVGVRDPNHALVRLADARVTPQAAVFNRGRKLIYSGRIDDLFLDFGKSRRAPTRHDLEDAIQATLENRRVIPASTPAIGCYIDDLE
ncbi:MAG TPA: redoxin domain-containing protein, partial [Pirellulaceae bacterium]